jgi:uncharacterized membrane protein|tara:strand:+ start:3997 stop:4239 length:243 start_codon:yes stop_codon:yes gene_type:complete
MVTNYINKDEFQQKIRAMRVKLHMENNKTLTWVIYIAVSMFALLFVVGAVTLILTLLILFIIGLPLAFIEGVIKGYRKNE